LTNVPFALPTSAIARPVCVKMSLAWNGSTLPSMIWMPASMLDPITTSRPVMGMA
jgi:hypothetical protein